MYIPGSPLSQPWLTIVSAKFDTSCTFWSDPPKLASDQAQGPPRRLTSLEPTRVVFSQRPLVVVLDGGLWAWSQGIGMDTGEGYGEWSRQAWISSWYIIWNHKISALDRPWKSQSHQAIDHRPPPQKKWPCRNPKLPKCWTKITAQIPMPFLGCGLHHPSIWTSTG